MNSAAASKTCSQLSNTINKRRLASAWAMLSVRVNPSAGLTPKMPATTLGIAPGPQAAHGERVPQRVG